MTAETYYEIMAEYARLERAADTEGGTADMVESVAGIFHMGALEGMRRLIAILNGMPPGDVGEGSAVARHIAAWQESHRDYLARALA